MTIKVERYNDMERASRNRQGHYKYLLFKKPREMYISEDDETHDKILSNSGRELKDIVSAGSVNEEYDMVSVLPWGSTNLNIRPSDAQDVVVFLKNLPGAKGKSIEGL